MIRTLVALILLAAALAAPASAQFMTLGVGGSPSGGAGSSCGTTSLDFSDTTGCDTTLYMVLLK